ncbi:sigma factor [Actinomadura sp. WAC 06369]|uniref:sigma factor n=1 Tax=Actinomadura sp. WAC 06369 TaxID=2203193 RepID=UPI001315587D|nr:sigma factor [Actinomadura sp. WAC 06369]
MSGWPTFDRADDERSALALAGGDPAALLQVMDRYAARLYDYCHALLRDRDEAAGALHDALVGAHAQISRLREPHLFRAWLYALVRAECLRRLGDPGRPVERHEAPEVEDGFLGEDELARRLEARRLVRGALAVLRGRERESLDLMLRHGLDDAEIGGVLDMDAPEAAELTGAARARLDDAIAAAHLLRTAPDACPHLAGVAGGGDAWPLPAAAVRDLVRHVGSCPRCAPHVDRSPSAGRLLGLLPVAMMPHDLRGRVMTTATDPAMAAEYAAVADRSGPFDEWGWPVSGDGASGAATGTPGGAGHGDGRDGRGRRGLLPALGAGAAVVLVVLAAFAMMPDASDESPLGARPGPSGTAAVAPDPSRSPANSASPSESPSPSDTPTPSATPSATSASPSRSATPRRTPTRSSRPSRPSGPDGGGQASGSLRVDGGGCSLSGSGDGCSIPVRAVGGPVRWSAGASAPLSVSGGGTLASGGSGAASVSLSCLEPGSGTGAVAFSPGGASVQVSWTCPGGDDGDGQGGGADG